MNRLRTLAVAGALIIPGLAMPAPAEAQWAPQSEPAFAEGYERGSRAGAEDYRRGDQYQFNDESDFRRGDLGYRSQYGNRDYYRDVFRRGFESGYRDGYGTVGYGRGNGPTASPRVDNYAWERGLNDGYEAGLNDARGRRRYDPVSEGRFRSADRGYNSRYGSREAYKLTYRNAFKTGYDRGFNDGRRYSRPRFGGLFGF